MSIPHRLSSTGRRRLTEDHLEAERIAAKFNGLPEGVKHHDQLWRAFRAAVPSLGIPRHLFYPLEVLFSHTFPQDWERDSRPVVWLSNQELMVLLDCSETEVRAILNALIVYKLIAFRDSPNGKRFGRRDDQGRILEAYGLVLSPLAVRFDEFRAAAEAGRAEREAIKDLRRRASIAKSGILQLIETAREQGFDRPDAGFDLAGLVAEVETILRTFDRDQTVEARTTCVLTLERYRQQAFEWLSGLLRSVTPEGQPAGSRGHYTDTDPGPLMEDTVSARQACNPQAAEQPASGPPPSPSRSVWFDSPAGITTTEALSMDPRFSEYFSRHRDGPPIGWADLLDVAPFYAVEVMDISRKLWDTAARVMGPGRALIALLVADIKPGVRKPGGYFHGMVEKAKKGELNLTATIFGLRKARRPASGGSSSHGGAHEAVQGSWL